MFSPKPGPEERAVGAFAKPIHVKNFRWTLERLAHAQPVAEIVAPCCRPQRQHRHGIATHIADGASRRGGGLGGPSLRRRRRVDPVEGLENERSVVARRPPKMMPLIGTPFGSSASGASAGLFTIGAAKRLFGCAALSFDAGVQGRPASRGTRRAARRPCPPHQSSPSGSSATLV